MEITFCLNSVKARSTTLNGREYLVAPITLIVPGVLNGSKGALFYPDSEVSKNPSVWNNTPIVVFHPTDDKGNPLSATLPSVLKKSGIGFITDARYQGKLRATGWFDVEKTKKVDRRVYESIKNGTPMEISTGVFTDNFESPGYHKGKAYDKVAKNYRPDHLAILPGIKGACSLLDGCGLMVNQGMNNLTNNYNQEDNEMSLASMLRNEGFASDAQRKGFFGVQEQKAEAEHKSTVAKIHSKDASSTNGRSKAKQAELHDKASDSHKSAALEHAKLARMVGDNKKEKEKHVAMMDHHKAQSAMHSIKSDALKGKTQEVDEVHLNSLNGKTAKVKFLTANCECWSGEGDEALLNGMSEDKLDLLVNAVKKADKTVKEVAEDDDDDDDEEDNDDDSELEDDEDEDNDDDDDEDDDEMVDIGGKGRKTLFGRKKSVTNKLSMNEWRRLMPVEAKEQWQFVEKETNRQRASLINKLTANASSEKVRKRLVSRLQGKGLNELRDLLNMLPRQAYSSPSTDSPSYLGANGGNVTFNSDESELDQADTLSLPVMNYEGLYSDKLRKQS